MDRWRSALEPRCAPSLRSKGRWGPLGYSISQKVRVLDVVRAASDSPEITTPVGPSLGDMLMPALRADAGPFCQGHPWLRPGDWDYAFKSHFDFVVHAPLGERHATQPLFAVEFDGPSHRQRDVRVRDCRKNRLCAASGLPPVRIDDTFLLASAWSSSAGWPKYGPRTAERCRRCWPSETRKWSP